MQRAGAAAAGEIALRYRDRLEGFVLVLAGPGNNGGDAWVVARALATAGAHVRVVEPIAAKTPDALAERSLAVDAIAESDIETASLRDSLDRGEAVVVDGLLGTGGSGEPRGDLARALALLEPMRARGATIVALDVPSGLDVSTGAARGAVRADLTLTFGTIKRGHLINRDLCGAIVVIDIGLGAHALLRDGAPLLIDEAWVGAKLPEIAASAHKGARKKIAIVGGGKGMAGAAMLAARAALRSGVGMVKLVISPESLAPVQQSEPYALAAVWPSDDAAVDRDIGGWADAVVIGPGLGRDDESRALLERVLRRWKGPTVLDADALTLFEGHAAALAEHLAGRPVLITPHPVEFARLAGVDVSDVLTRRFDVGREMAATLGERAAVLLKGVPTVVSGASGEGQCLVSANGTPALATAGSGDVLSGIAGTMLAQLEDPLIAGAIAAWVHGRAAERVPSASPTDGGVRGIALEDVVNELRDSWTFDARPMRYPVLAELPAAGEGAR